MDIYAVGMGGGVAFPFLGIEKLALILGKDTLIVSIYWLNISFETRFQEHLREKKLKNVSLRGLPLLCCG